MSDEYALTISGGSLTDELFTNDRGTWNVTRAKSDCAAGKYGAPVLTELRAMVAANKAVTVDDQKVLSFVDRFTKNPQCVYDDPFIAVMDGGKAWLIDGHHRLRAWGFLGLSDALVYVIEEAHGPDYLVLFNGHRSIEAAQAASSI